MKFLGFDEYFSFDNRLDEIEDIKQHVEVVYQYVKDHVEQEQSKYQLPDINSDDVTCTMALNPFKGEDGPFVVKLHFPLISEDPEDEFNFRKYITMQQFFEGELTGMFKQFNIDIFYPNRDYYEGIRDWKQL